MDVLTEVLNAEERIRPHIRETILEHSPALSERGGASVYCKLENLQHTGSFKVRGALNKVLSLTEEQRARGVVTASTGNHGAAVAYSLGKLKAKGIVFVPQNADPSKVEATVRLGAELLASRQGGASRSTFVVRDSACDQWESPKRSGVGRPAEGGASRFRLSMAITPPKDGGPAFCHHQGGAACVPPSSRRDTAPTTNR
jgi:hypothetical protein